jgi:transposase InsO family protein
LESEIDFLQAAAALRTLL